MFERFTDRARRVVVLAQEEARRLNHSYIGTEHILLGVILEGEGVAAKALESVGLSLEDVRAQVEEALEHGQEAPPGHIPFTPRAKKILELSLREALMIGHNYIGTEHILLGLIRHGEGVAAQILAKQGVGSVEIRERILEMIAAGAGQGRGGGATAGSPLLDKFGKNLTQAARGNRLDPVIGREQEMGRIMLVLARRTKNAPILVGEPGIGKRRIIEGLAQAIVRGEVPLSLEGKILYELNFDKVFNSEDAAAIEFTEVLEEVKTRGDIVLFVPDISKFVGQIAMNKMSALAQLFSLLQGGSTSIIGSSTSDDFRRSSEEYPEMHHLMTQVPIGELTIPATIEHLKAERDRLEAYHRLTISNGSLHAAAILAHQYLRDQFLPESAIGLLDEAAASLRLKRLTPPPDIRDLDDKIRLLQLKMEQAIDSQDFEAAKSIHESRAELSAVRADKERNWKVGAWDQIPELHEAEVIAAAAGLSGRSESELWSTLSPSEREGIDKSVLKPNRPYLLLGDQPVVDIKDDMLDAAATAAKISAAVSDSRASSPFVMALDGGWGTGKSTLLNQISSNLSAMEGVEIVQFNAWTSPSNKSLEGLIKSVLVRLDPNLLRRGLKRLVKQRRVLLFGRLVLGAFARFLGAARLIDEIWEQMGMDSKGQNELRTMIFDMLTEWTERRSKGASLRSLIIVIDDLDRCSDEVIMKICEAVKLYLDAPGLIFIMGCDLNVIRRGIASSQPNEAKTYLEKIIQVVHRVQPPKEEQLKSLIRGYADRSGTAHLINREIEDILAKRAGRNPRRIKRIINSFVLESRLNPAWSSRELGNDQLIKAVILQHLYPSFYEYLIGSDSGSDPVGDFLDYAVVKGRAADPPPTNDAWWSTCSKLFLRYEVSPPPRSVEARDALPAALERLEGLLPAEYPVLVRDAAFTSLLQRMGDVQARVALRSQLANEPLRTEAFTEAIDEDEPVV